MDFGIIQLQKLLERVENLSIEDYIQLYEEASETDFVIVHSFPSPKVTYSSPRVKERIKWGEQPQSISINTKNKIDFYLNPLAA